MLPNMSIKVLAQSKTAAEILIYGDIGEGFFTEGVTAQSVKAQLDALGPISDIDVRINSGGGNFWDGLAIHSLLKSHRAQVHVHVDGLAASAASVIAMAGDLVSMAEGAFIMIHRAAMVAAGDGDNLRHAAGVLDQIDEQMAELYAKRTGINSDDLLSMMAAETWLNADRAVELHFADEISGAALDVAASFDLSRFTNVPEVFAVTKQTQQPTPVDASAVLAADKARRTEIRNRFGRFADQHRDLLDQCLDDTACTAATAGEKLLAKLGEGATPVSGGYTSAPADNEREFRAAYSDALLIRAGIRLEKPHPGARDLLRMSALDAIRTMLSQRDRPTGGSADRILASMTTSDFPQLLANVAEKAVLQGYMNPDRGTHRTWTRSTTLPDFKLGKRVSTGETPSLARVPEGAEFTYGSLPDYGVDVQLATYGRILKFTRQAIINDDTDSLMQAARSFGDSAVRLEADTVYSVLVSNPTMPDSVALFHATHDNLGTAGAPSVTTLGEARKLLRNQRGLNDESYLDIEPAILLVPTALETTCEQLLSSIWDPAGANQQTNNPFASKLELVVDPRLDANSTTAWYVLASPSAFGWFEAIRLRGQEEPFVDEKVGWEVDGLEIKCRHDFAAAAVAFQGAVKNAGA
jgi:ATP-dependent protease ClpP protease subunit